MRKLVNIEGLGPVAASSRRDRRDRATAERLRKWIEDKRKAAGRLPRRYPTIEAAYARMKDENAFLTDEQARHLTIHGINRNEDGTWSWKFDNYLNVWPVDRHPACRESSSCGSAITCPMLLLYGADSFASNPERDGRMQHFNTARRDRIRECRPLAAPRPVRPVHGRREVLLGRIGTQ